MTNQILDLGDILFRDFDAGACRNLEVDGELPGIGPGEKSQPQEGIDGEASLAKHSAENGHREAGTKQCALHPILVMIQKPVELPVETGSKPIPPRLSIRFGRFNFVFFVLRMRMCGMWYSLEKPRTEKRNDRHRNQI